ncbi:MULTISPECIES: hypothetical protein [Halorussus]|uniref:hypothetical protein n=1 Tax=Halorussus TaxID=1070314 RepID=UPI00209ED6FD|nr:hypothetical protein [Halorussus vallis]USZ77751.1 hypothetical protein NGM07_21455 [Halorussus vallis]
MSLPPKRWAREPVPVAAILLFWNLLAVVAQMQNVGGPVRDAGIVMAALYVVVRGVSLSAEVQPTVAADVEAVLHENARLAVLAGAWFLGAIIVYAGDGNLYAYGPSSGAVALGSALAGAGLGVVGLYAVAVGYATLGESASPSIASDASSDD